MGGLLLTASLSPDLMETFHYILPNSQEVSLVPITLLFERKGVVAGEVGCGRFNRVLKANATQITNVGRLCNSQAIFVMGNVFLFHSAFLPLELANAFQ